ncbi:MAG: hypothetical protein Q4F71_12200 [Paracoccus sp. (in: a-proteobacteria)]|nr:hypothetical protein [Paracoccus sp. (in: a-proteobacteria)]
MSRDPFIRPEIAAWLRANAEPLWAAVALLVSVWIATRGGFLLPAMGGIAGVASAIWLVGALRRGAFRREITAPGVVEIDEGAIRYFAPAPTGAIAIGGGGPAQGAHAAPFRGGQVALRDLVEIRLIALGDQDHWRLRTTSGEALLIPVSASGAARLADAFEALPGIEMGRVSAALSRKRRPQPGDATRIVWQRNPSA